MQDFIFDSKILRLEYDQREIERKRETIYRLKSEFCINFYLNIATCGMFVTETKTISVDPEKYRETMSGSIFQTKKVKLSSFFKFYSDGRKRNINVQFIWGLNAYVQLPMQMY